MGIKWYKFKNLFKSKDQIELETRMKFNQTKRSFAKYSQELDGNIKQFTKMARDAELSGNHANALSCVKFVQKLQRTQVKVQSLVQHFEMTRSMQQMASVMSKFMRTCAEMGFNIDSNIDLKSMMKDTMAMDKALNKLDAMTDQMDMVFDVIDGGIKDSETDSLTEEEMNTEAEAMLNQIMGTHNIMSYPDSVTEETQQSQMASAEEDIDERLRKMRQELNE